MIWGNHTVAEALNVTFNLVGVAIAVSALGILVVRRRAATARRAPDPRPGPGLRRGHSCFPRSRVRYEHRLASGEQRRLRRRPLRVRLGAPASSSRACSGSGWRAPQPASCCRRSPRRRRSRRPRTACAGRCTTPPSSSRGGCRRAAGTSTAEGHPFTPTEAPGRATTTRRARGPTARGRGPRRRAAGRARAAERRPGRRQARSGQGPAPGRAPREAGRAAAPARLHRRAGERGADVLLRDRPRGTDRSLQRHADRRERNARRRDGPRQGRSGRSSSPPRTRRTPKPRFSRRHRASTSTVGGPPAASRSSSPGR